MDNKEGEEMTVIVVSETEDYVWRDTEKKEREEKYIKGACNGGKGQNRASMRERGV